jgi:hypothetical protein
MKALAAALIAIATLYLFDSLYDEGRYATVIQQAAMSVLPG